VAWFGCARLFLCVSPSVVLLLRMIALHRHERSSVRTEIVPYSCVEDECGAPGSGFRHRSQYRSEPTRSSVEATT
jgi:hypothetical protein